MIRRSILDDFLRSYSSRIVSKTVNESKMRDAGQMRGEMNDLWARLSQR